jgi:hypothetical protein
MLPPFVPPSARSASEHLPSITEFVVDRVDRSFNSTFVLDTPKAGSIAVEPPSPLSEEAVPVQGEAKQGAIETAPQVRKEGDGFIVDGIEYSATLPSIEEFVLRKPYVGEVGFAEVNTSPVTDDSPFVQLQRRAAVGESERAKKALSQAVVSSSEGEQGAINAPSSSMTISSSSISPSSSEEEHDWVEEERDSFDWQSVATLAAPADDAERAAQEWMSTDWETPSTSPSEHVAATLMRLARRIRSGELKIEAVPGKTPEAALAAVLAALLSDPDAGMK